MPPSDTSKPKVLSRPLIAFQLHTDEFARVCTPDGRTPEYKAIDRVIQEIDDPA